jgi:hypothetical protein
MKLLFGILIGLVGITFVLAYAFLGSDNIIILNENMGISDTITATVIKGG